jgi:CO/xanthine dehydrogenase FAD-binding subunit
MFRRLPRFDYFAPTTIGEAFTLLSKFNGRAKVLAGGTDLLVQMKWKRISLPSVIIGLSRIIDLNKIESNPEGIVIGALTKIHDIEESKVIHEKFPILIHATSGFGSVEIRNLATLGGNLCNASPDPRLEARKKSVQKIGA